MSRLSAAAPLPVAGAGRRRAVVAVAVVAVVGLVALGAAAVGRDGAADRAPTAASTPSGATPGPVATPSAVQAWRDGVVRDFQQLSGSSFSAVRTVTEWNLGRASAGDVAARAEIAVVSSQDTVDALAARQPLPGTQQSLTEYRAAADLYQQSMRIVLAAAKLPAGALQTQLRRSSARVRDLGDRLFDQAGVTLAPLLPPDRTFEGVEVRKPPDVPDYDAIDLGVGPPLEPAPPAPGPVRTYQAQRPEQPVDAWVQALERLSAPSSQEVAALVGTGTDAQRAAAARRLVEVADDLRAEADPQGARAVSTQVQLAFLVHSDALRTAQAAALVPVPLRRGLAVVAEQLAGTAATLREIRP